MPANRIMIVEDESITAHALANDLAGLGYEVAAMAISGERAVKLVSECGPDLVLMDIKLAGDLSGIEAAAEIRRMQPVPVVYLTSWSDEEFLSQAKTTEPFGYLLKPYNLRELLTTIEMALYKADAEARLRASERKFSAVFSDNPALMALTAMSDGRFLEVNKAFAAASGLSRDEIVGRTIKDLGIGCPLERWDELESLLRKFSEFKGLEADFTGKAGKNFSMLWSGDLLEVGGEDCVVWILQDITLRKQLEDLKDDLIRELSESLAMNKKLSGLLPICSSCKKIRNSTGEWEQLEDFITERSEANFSHGICPECAKKLYPEFCGN